MVTMEPEQPGRNGPPALDDAWAAFSAMLAGKREHFDFLQTLESRYRHGGEPNEMESDRLAALLANHDACVGRFRAAVSTLRREHPDLAAEFLRALARVGEDST